MLNKLYIYRCIFSTKHSDREGCVTNSEGDVDLLFLKTLVQRLKVHEELQDELVIVQRELVTYIASSIYFLDQVELGFA